MSYLKPMGLTPLFFKQLMEKALEASQAWEEEMAWCKHSCTILKGERNCPWKEFTFR